MTAEVASYRLPDLDDPWRRLPWIVPLAIALWIAGLVGFSLLLTEAPTKQIEFKPIEARIVEIPQETSGLKGSGGEAAPAAAAPEVPKPPPPVPVVKPKPKPIAKL